MLNNIIKNILKKSSYIKFLIKKILPKTLFARSLLIIALSIFIIQLLVIVFFYDNHWRKVRTSVFQILSRDISYIVYLVDNAKDEIEITNAIELSAKKLNLYPKIIEQNFIPNNKDIKNENVKDLVERIQISTKKLVSAEEYSDDYSIVKINVALNNNHHIIFYLDKDVFQIASVKYIIFFVIIFYLSILLIIIHFFRIQLRPLKELAKFAKKFGKGDKVQYIQPRGSSEIKQLIITFNEMKDQIQNFIEQRTMLLSSVSHDLKTSLTKLKLMVELSDINNQQQLLNEVNTMQEMISSYLNFTKSVYFNNHKSTINIKQFIENVITGYKNTLSIKVEYNQNTKIIFAEELSLYRAIINILDNANKYAKNILIQINNLGNHNIELIIEDDGIGVDENNLENIFKPFYRANTARTAEKSSVGLGLYIVKEIILKHGGNISASKSKIGGLKITINLPF